MLSAMADSWAIAKGPSSKRSKPATDGDRAVPKTVALKTKGPVAKESKAAGHGPAELPPLHAAIPSAQTRGASHGGGARSARLLQLDELVAAAAHGDNTAAAEARFEALTVERGERAFAHALERTRELAAKGVRVVWGFDLDNTLYDTRARTLAIGKDFDAAHGTRYFDKLDVTDLTRIGRDGAATAQALGLSAEHAKEFTELWGREFWNPARLVHDVELPDMVARARAVLEAGGTLRYITGRAEQWTDGQTGRPMSFRADTLARIARSGLPAASESLVLKPKPGGNTPLFKREVLQKLDQEPNTVVAGFVTDTLTELLVMKHVDAIPCFWVRTSFEVAKKKSSPPWVYSLPLAM